MFDTLRNLDLFSHFSDEELKVFSNSLTRRTFSAGQYLIKEESDARCFFIIESGHVDILKQSTNGSNSHISEEPKGSIVGEVDFFHKHERSSSIIAKDRVTALELSFTSLQEMIAADRNTGLKLYQTIASALAYKLKRTTSEVSELVASSRLIALGDLVTTIIHDINNPLSTIRILSERLTNEAPGATFGLGIKRSVATTIDKAFEHIMKIMEGVKLASHNAQNDRLEYVNIKNVLESTVALCQGKLKDSAVSLKISVKPENLKIHCRPTHICQVLLNLISNSYDAVENLSERWIKIEVNAYGDFDQITVSDSGSGIPKDLREKIFNPYFSTKGVGKGTGIGLSLSKKIIESYHGRFYLNKDSPHTHFVIQIPKQA